MISNAVTSLRIVLLVPLLVLLGHAGAADRWAALAVFLLAGLTDIVDGRIARAFGEVSRLGAFLDLIADRLLTLSVVAGLVASGELAGPFMVAGVTLVARDLIVASFGEAAPTVAIEVTTLERVKIALQFAAFGLLVAPPVAAGLPQHDLGRWLLAASALLAVLTVIGYARRTAAGLSAH